MAARCFSVRTVDLQAPKRERECPAQAPAAGTPALFVRNGTGAGSVHFVDTHLRFAEAVTA
jgi:hypothetical protein